MKVVLETFLGRDVEVEVRFLTDLYDFIVKNREESSNAGTFYYDIKGVPDSQGQPVLVIRERYFGNDE